LIKDKKGTLLGTIINWDQLPDIDPGNIPPELREHYKNHYFDSVTFEDTLILFTPLLPVKIIDYLSLYVEPGNKREAQEKRFTEAVDSLIIMAGVNENMRDVVVNYLIGGFQQYGFEDIITHIVENYIVGSSCVSDQEESRLVKRVEGFKKLAIGNLAPDISLPDLQGNQFTMSASDSEYFLVVFWASWCPHCSGMLPEIDRVVGECAGQSSVVGRQFVPQSEASGGSSVDSLSPRAKRVGDQQPVADGQRISVVYISIDTSEAAWREAAQEKGLQGVHLCDLKGWDGKAASDYYLYATPTLILLDRDRKILYKPMGAEELSSALKNLGICGR
jgi:thiol-disulfide isomerase/thioredoxin